MADASRVRVVDYANQRRSPLLNRPRPSRLALDEERTLGSEEIERWRHRELGVELKPEAVQLVELQVPSRL